MALNTTAIPRDLLEAELFGNERAQFGNTKGLKRGALDQAEGGTLFLDEVGEIPFELQTRLLRVLTDGHFYRAEGSD